MKDGKRSFLCMVERERKEKRNVDAATYCHLNNDPGSNSEICAKTSRLARFWAAGHVHE